MNKSVYIAAPFFTPEQSAVVDRIEKTLNQFGVSYFSPRRECLCEPNCSAEKRRRAFEGNLVGVEEAKVVLAWIEGYDAGTMFEVGYAFRAQQTVAAMMFGENPKVNLMLAEGVDGFLLGWDSVETFIQQFSLSGIPNQNVLSLWKKEIE